MASRPPVRRYGAPKRASPVAALVGMLLGFGVLAALGWGALKLGREAVAPAPPPPATTSTVPAKPVLRIVFPEGFTRQQMAQRITAVNQIAKRKRKITPRLSTKEYLRLTRRGKLPQDFKGTKLPHLEGFLFPATYQFTEDTTTRRLVAQQLEAFARAWEQVDMKYARSKNLTPYDVLIIASMVEKEVQVPKERPLVAAVIYNRLKVGLPLGIDATLRYGLEIPPTEAIRQSQLESDTPYNTRKFLGLTPTPIANPGLASIQAAAPPADVYCLYFVRKPDCKSHFFTASEDEFFSYTRQGLQC